MKYFIIPFIALGFVLSLIFGVEYICEGQEMFPAYYGSPFVFKQKSLGSSMEYFYSVSGLLLNTAIWSFVFNIIRLAFLKLIGDNKDKRIIKLFSKIFIGVLIAFTCLNILISVSLSGRGFQKGFNYWYMDLDKEAEAWGMVCEGEWRIGFFD